MDLTSLLIGRAVIDGRAGLRDRATPGEIAVLRSNGPFAEVIDDAMRSNPIPAAIVHEDGRIMVLTSGGSAVVWANGNETAEQMRSLDRVLEALVSMGAHLPGRKPVQESQPEPVPDEQTETVAVTPKKRKRPVQKSELEPGPEQETEF